MEKNAEFCFEFHSFIKNIPSNRTLAMHLSISLKLKFGTCSCIVPYRVIMVECRQNIQFLIEFSLFVVANFAGKQVQQSFSLATHKFQSLFLNSFHKHKVHFATGFVLRKNYEKIYFRNLDLIDRISSLILSHLPTCSAHLRLHTTFFRIVQIVWIRSEPHALVRMPTHRISADIHSVPYKCSSVVAQIVEDSSPSH